MHYFNNLKKILKMKINLFKYFILIFIIFSCSSEADINDSNTGGNWNSGNGGDNDNDSGGGSGGDNNDDQTNFYLDYESDLWGKPASKSRIGVFKDLLSMQEINAINLHCKRIIDFFNY